MNLVIDIGNTKTKLAVFKGETLIEKRILPIEDLIKNLKEINLKFKLTNAILSSVVKLSAKFTSEIENIIPFIALSEKTKVPFINMYKTPKTLGLDRVALVAGAVKKFSKKNVLIIDAGSCITYDFVDNTSTYLGGAISPGIEMRFKALHKFTSKLPLLYKNSNEDIVGKSTEESMRIGVVDGVLNEIEGFIKQYKKKYAILTIVLTGGDTNFLSKQLKSSIFANQNFLLEGLNNILIFNLNK